jgi:small subunit ribosomal protein S6e
VAYRNNGLHKAYKIDDEHKWGHVVDLKIGSEFDGEKVLGEAYKGYVLRITGGTDENGFPMKNGVLRKTRVKLLIPPRTCGLRSGREGERKRRSVRGCIIDRDIGAVHCAIAAKGAAEIDGLTNHKTPRRLGPKRANKIRKLFGLPKHSDKIVPKGQKKDQPAQKDKTKVNVDRFDVTRYVVKRPTKTKGDKQYYKAPKIQRLVTSQRIRRKTLRRKEKIESVTENNKVYGEFVARLKAARDARKKAETEATTEVAGTTATKPGQATTTKPGQAAATKPGQAAPAKPAATTKPGQAAPAKPATTATQGKPAPTATATQGKPAQGGQAAPAKQGQPAPAKPTPTTGALTTGKPKGK